MKGKKKSKAQSDIDPSKLQERITELETAEKDRQQTEEAYKVLIENSLQGLIIVQDNHIIFANLPFIDMSGYSLTKIFSFSTDDIKSLIHPDDRAQVWTDLKNRLAGKKAPSAHKFRFIRKDSSVCWVEALSSFITYRTKPAMQMTFLDISNYIKAEEALRVERNRAQKYLDVAGVMFVVIDSDEKVTLINQKGCEILGYKEKEIIGKSWFDNFIPEKLRDEIKSVFSQLIKGEIAPVEHFENPVLTKSGEEKTIAWHNTVLTNESDEIIGTLSSGDDITESKKINDQIIEERNRAELFLDILGHDINNLSQGIITASELMLMKPDISEEQKRYMQTSYNQATAISSLISNVQKISELQVSDFKLELLDITKMLTASKDWIKKAYTGRKIEITHDIPESKIVVKCNPLMQDVFDNIITNAVKYNRNEIIAVEIKCSEDEDGKYWRLEFKDNGTGIPDEMKEQIFKRLDRDKKSTLRSGIGLSIVNEVIKRCSGKVWVEDAVPGDSSKGSNFIVMLPKGKMD